MKPGQGAQLGGGANGHDLGQRRHEGGHLRRRADRHPQPVGIEGNLRPTRIFFALNASMSGATSRPASIMTKFASEGMNRRPSAVSFR